MRYLRTQTSKLLIAGFGLALALGLIIFTASNGSNFAALSTGPTVTAAPIPSSTRWYDSLPSDKRDVVMHGEQTRDASLTAFPATKVPLPTEQVVLTPYYPDIGSVAGSGRILENVPIPFCSTCFVVTNVWYEAVHGRNITIYAGAIPDQPGAASQPASQGAVVVIGEPSYTTPSKLGAVRIIGAQGERLILQSKDGTVFYFDLPARRFVASLEEIVPTATVAPIATMTVPPTRRPYP